MGQRIGVQRTYSRNDTPPIEKVDCRCRDKKENNLPSQMSGGQQQRVAIARAIVNDAPLILADEPTGNLDTKTSIDVMEFFVNLNEKFGKTIVLVTHEPDIAEYTKRILRFKDGKIIEDVRRR